jgi:hypothetical protein
MSDGTNESIKAKTEENMILKAEKTKSGKKSRKSNQQSNEERCRIVEMVNEGKTDLEIQATLSINKTQFHKHLSVVYREEHPQQYETFKGSSLRKMGLFIGAEKDSIVKVYIPDAHGKGTYEILRSDIENHAERNVQVQNPVEKMSETTNIDNVE